MIKLNKNNIELHGFSGVPVRDSHAHLCFEKPIDETVDNFKNILKHFNYSHINIAACPMYESITENYQAIYTKSKLSPNVYACAGPEYYCDNRDTADELLDQIKEYHMMGFDGIKLLDGKISQFRKTGYKLNDSIFNKFFEYAQENKLPVLLHLGDPEKNWDVTKATPYIIEKGWVYTEADPSLEELRSWVDDVLKKFPKLNLILAHFYFMSGELERLSKMLDTYENLCLDITPGGEMFVNFTNNYDNARAFFQKYSKRIMYGTDMYNTFENAEKAEAEVGGPRVFQARSMLEKTEDFYSKLISDKPLKPFGFNDEILDDIYRNNFIRLFGETPKPLDTERIKYNIKAFMNKGFKFNDTEKHNMKVISDYFK